MDELQRRISDAQARYDQATSQSAHITTYQQKLSDIEDSIQHEGLTKFVGPETQTAIDEVQKNLQQLSQTAPAKRGDVAASLEVLAARIRDLDTALASARTTKSQAEQTRRLVVENEGAAKRVLGAATNVDLGPAFDEQFAKSTNELIDRFRELENIELWAIPERQEDITAATRKLEELQQQIPEAQARYDQAKRLDERRQSVIERLSVGLREFSQPENRDRLSTDGVRIAIDEVRSELDVLSELDGKPLLARSDYRETLSAADETLGRIAQFKADAAEISELSGGLRALTGKVDERGRHLLDAVTSAQLVNLNNSVKALNAAKIPLASESRRQLAHSSTSLRQLESTVDGVMDREEKRLLRAEPSRS